MSENIQKAKNLLRETCMQFTKLCSVIAEERPLDPEANAVYNATAVLNILTSQLCDKDEPRTVEGCVEVYNEQAMVSIQGIELRGDTEFELLMDGKWKRGYRSNSQYGQVFIDENGNNTILSNAYSGRVSFPLHMFSRRDADSRII